MATRKFSRRVRDSGLRVKLTIGAGLLCGAVVFASVAGASAQQPIAVDPASTHPMGIALDEAIRRAQSNEPTFAAAAAVDLAASLGVWASVGFAVQFRWPTGGS